MKSKYTRIDQRIQDYLLAHQPPEHAELRALEERTHAMPQAFMQISPEQGHLLALLVRLTGARRCIEIGTFTGYSALAIALALPDQGMLVTCDISESWPALGRRHWERAGVSERIDLRIGPAVDTLARLEQCGGSDQFDFAFIDADKTGYQFYYERSLRLVRRGGLIVLDNTLRRGRVADPQDTEPETIALREINAKIAGDERVDRVLLPVASGMTLARRR